MKASKRLVYVGAIWASSALAAPGYVTDPDNTQSESVNDFNSVLRLDLINQADTGLTLAQRRAAIDFTGALTFADADSDLTTTAAQGSLTSYLYKFLSVDQSITGNLNLTPGITSTTPNLPIILDLGQSSLTVSGNLEMQGALVVSTINSVASSDGAVLNGTGALTIDASRSGRLIAGELLEVSSGTPANLRLALDLNSTLQDGASFDIATETAGTSGSLVSYEVVDSTNSRLYDTSYVMNSSAARNITGNNERITVTFSRADNEYITKSQTQAHPSNSAALTLGRIAADGVARGDMQTALTLLDINDFGYGNNAENLAVEVKRLAPIANNSFMIAHLDAVSMTADAVDYRLKARRGNWSGYSNLAQSVWARGLLGQSQSSGSVPEGGDGAQDAAGYDGFDTRTRGFSMGVDHNMRRGLIGVSLTQLRTDIRQIDDRLGENSVENLSAVSIYGQLKNRFAHLALTATRSDGELQGQRKTAVDRVANYTIDTQVSQLRSQVGRRFDMPDGRTAITPFAAITWSDYRSDDYQETGAGDLNLAVDALRFDRRAMEVGLSVSHKRRLSGVKALSMINIALGKDQSVDAPVVTARYTGDTNIASASYTTFDTATETWANNYVNLGFDVQLEPADNVMFKLGFDAQLRESRQRYGAELGLVWVF